MNRSMILAGLCASLFTLAAVAAETTPEQKKAAQFIIQNAGYTCDEVDYIVTELEATGETHIVVCNTLRFRYKIFKFKGKVIVKLT